MAIALGTAEIPLFCSIVSNVRGNKAATITLAWNLTGGAGTGRWGEAAQHR